MYAKTSKINYTPRKLRLVANLIKGKKAEEAMEYLKNVNKKGALFVYKTIKSALANAQNKGFNPSDLSVVDVRVDSSISLKRLFYFGRGRARLKLKRYSTLTVRLG
ncbi:MAG: 50S ribosomal protein L22 [Candidatus Dojkabacteria bacterium]|nr:MAG: 50S ribosomal protein L22 [Candidatus Dojkabacteria bacterium]